MRQYKGQSGYIALMAVLIVGAASLSIASLLLISATDASRSTLAEAQAVQARNLTSACAEEGLQVVRDNTNFTGTAGLTLGAGSCTYVVTTTGTSTRIIAATGTVNDLVRRAKIYVTIGLSSISVTSWQEVP